MRMKVGVALAFTCAAGAAQSAPRVLVDPWTGSRWQLETGSVHPGGPGQFAPAGSSAAVPRTVPHAVSVPLIIRAGDRLVVEESAGDLHARYAATAMAPAARGAVFLARLTFSGRPVRVVAVEPGHASLAPASFAHSAQEAQP
jgi:hypothetical protein